MSDLTTLPLMAGQRPDGQLIYEELPVKALAEPETYQLMRSPAFCKGLAKDDHFRRMPGGRFEVIQHSGQLAIRIISKEQVPRLAEQVQSSVAALKGTLDDQNERMLVVSIPVTAGFEAIEALMSDLLANIDNCAWFYGNVYDAMDGETPLNWWQQHLQDASDQAKEIPTPVERVGE